MTAQDYLKRNGISVDATVREAMKRINSLSGESMTLFALSPEGRLEGTITDGDIRRALIGGGELSDPVATVMNRHFLSARSPEELSLKMAEGRKRHIELLPLFEDGNLTDIIDLRATRAFLPLEAVLMAGGRGERLRPLTDQMPKPLLPVGDKAIIDYNVDELEACGIKKIHVTVNYLGHMIEEHFQDRNGRAKVECVAEPVRLGTFGSLALIGDVATDNILVMNSDLFSTVDFEAMFIHHQKHSNDFTIAAVPYSVSVPFAIMKLQGQRVKSLEEKPAYNYFANGGVYIMKSSLLPRIKRGVYLDAPDFILSLISDGLRVGSFHIEGTWIDIGSPDDYRMANELAGRGKL
ncbi:MAG: NTP transferase domain-containing protein [Muribaculaceae bacterium]|nr:NTP transferase domain-containing protein [Muribaculaceae bacterium]